MKLRLRLVEASPINGSLRFELEEGANHLPIRGGARRDGKGRARPMTGRRGRPSNIRHKGGRR